MDEAVVGGWAARATPKLDILGSLHELNRRFLDLAAANGRDAPAGRAAALSAAQRAAAANCPYALFDVRFQDEHHWQPRLTKAMVWSVAEAPAADAEAVDFVRLALFYVWHLATTAPLRAQLLLGMPERIAAAFASLTVDRLPEFAASEAVHLTARWHTSHAYWDALLAAAAHAHAPALRRAQLCGIQLAAAARLP
jgi:hypothetical protein